MLSLDGLCGLRSPKLFNWLSKTFFFAIGFFGPVILFLINVICELSPTRNVATEKHTAIAITSKTRMMLLTLTKLNGGFECLNSTCSTKFLYRYKHQNHICSLTYRKFQNHVIWTIFWGAVLADFIDVERNFEVFFDFFWIVDKTFCQIWARKNIVYPNVEIYKFQWFERHLRGVCCAPGDYFQIFNFSFSHFRLIF